MSKKQIDVQPATRDAISILGVQVRLARRERGWSSRDLADRIGVSRATVLSIENGAPGTSIANAFNAATMAGVPLFGTGDPTELARMRREGEERLARSRRSKSRPKGANPKPGTGRRS